jgi:competence protein ComEA
MRREQPAAGGIATARLRRLLGAEPAGWVPTPPDAVPVPPAPSAPPSAVPSEVGSAVGSINGGSLRWRPQPQAVAGLLAVGLAVVLVTGYLTSRHQAAPVHEPPTTVPSLVATPPPVGIVVDVSGRVRHPGLVSLPVGARVDDAIRAAGGALPGTSLAGLNLAAKVTDGQLVVVGPAVAGGANATSGGAAAGLVGGGPVDLNSATVEQLDALPGVGPVLAQRIVAWRERNGGFRSVDQLQQIPGIGARKFTDLRSLVSV